MNHLGAKTPKFESKHNNFHTRKCVLHENWRWFYLVPSSCCRPRYALLLGLSIYVGVCGSVYVSTRKIHKSISYLRYAYNGKYRPRYIYICHIREGEWPNAIACFIYHLSICGICHIITGWGKQISDQVNIHVWFVKYGRIDVIFSFHSYQVAMSIAIYFLFDPLPLGQYWINYVTPGFSNEIKQHKHFRISW